MRGIGTICATLGLIPALLLLGPGKGVNAKVAFDQDPVVFVHGCTFVVPKSLWESSSGKMLEEDWRRMTDAFRAAGYPNDHLVILAFSEPCGRNSGSEQELAAAVDMLLRRIGRHKVDLVGHSMACLSTRLFAANSRQVDDVIAIAGTCHGTDQEVLRTVLTLNGENEGISDIVPAYACAGVQADLNGCFDPATGVRTSSFDETPGRASIHTIYTDTDELIRPFESACVGQRFMNDCSSPINHFVGGRSHFTILNDDEVIDVTLELVKDRRLG